MDTKADFEDTWGNQNNKPHAQKKMLMGLRARLREYNQQVTDMTSIINNRDERIADLEVQIDSRDLRIAELEDTVTVLKGEQIKKRRAAKKTPKSGSSAKKEPKDG